MDDLTQRLRAVVVEKDTEGDEYRIPVNPDGPTAADRIEADADRIAELEALVEEARVAIMPMVQHAKERVADDEFWTDRDVVTCILSIPELRRAAALLARLGGKHDRS